MSHFTLVIGNKNTSSWSLRPWLLMRTAGVPFDEVHVRLRQPDTRAQCLRHSPSGMVPVLKHDGLTIWESLAICEYLAERYPERELWPTDAAARAQARAVSSEMHAGFRALRQHMPMDCLGRHPGQAHDAEGVAQDIARISGLWNACRAEWGSAGAFLFGKFSIADAMFAPVVSRFETYAVPVDETCRTYMDHIFGLPAMAEWLTGCEA